MYIDDTTQILKNLPDAEAYTLRSEPYFLPVSSDMEAAIRSLAREDFEEALKLNAGKDWSIASAAHVQRAELLLRCEIPNRNTYIQACKDLTLALEICRVAENRPESLRGVLKLQTERILKLRAICLNALTEYQLAYHDAKILPFLVPTRECYLIRAEALSGLGFVESAACDREIAMLFHSDIEEIVERALRTLNSGEFKSAHKRLNEALSAFEEQGVIVPELVLLRGIASWMAEEIGDAASDFDTAREADPLNNLDAVVLLFSPGPEGGRFPQILFFMTDNYEQLLQNQKDEAHALMEEGRRRLDSDPVLTRAYLNAALEARPLEFEEALLHSLAVACERMGDGIAAFGAISKMLDIKTQSELARSGNLAYRSRILL